jgi:hypothetical protein
LGFSIPQDYYVYPVVSSQDFPIRTENHALQIKTSPTGSSPVCRRVATSHNRTMPPGALVATVFPSGLRPATPPVMGPEDDSGICLLVARSHNQVPPEPAVATARPSGVNAT